VVEEILDFWQAATMACEHEWTLFCGTLPSGATFRGGYFCEICGTHVPECPAGGHPFGFPYNHCPECKPEKQHLSS